MENLCKDDDHITFQLFDEDDEWIKDLNLEKLSRSIQPTFIETNEKEKQQFLVEMRNKNTVKKTELCERQFHRWLETQGEERRVWDMDPVELDPLIGSFLLSIRKGDGTEYEPDTLTSYHRGIDRCLREHGYQKSIVMDREFASSRAVLLAKRKSLKAQGKGNRPNAAEPLTPDDQELLREKGCVGSDSPQQLLNQVWLNNTVLFGLRGGKENHDLRWGDVALAQDEKGREYLELNERSTKTRTGESSNHHRAFKPKQYAHTNKGTCPVAAYKAYAEHRPNSMMEADSPFYLAINHLRKPTSQQWYKAQPLGENSIRQLMGKMSSKAGLTGRKTNHSARKTTCTKLLHAGIAPTTIQQLTGHRNVQSINNYAVASKEMQREMSNILSDGQAIFSHSSAPANALIPTTSSSAITPAQQAIFTQNTLSTRDGNGQILQGAKLINCTVNLYNREPVNSPPRKYRRLQIIESDSD